MNVHTCEGCVCLVSKCVDTGVPLSRENASPQDPTVALCLRPNGDPRGVAFCCERGTPVRTREEWLSASCPDAWACEKCVHPGDSRARLIHGANSTETTRDSPRRCNENMIHTPPYEGHTSAPAPHPNTARSSDYRERYLPRSSPTRFASSCSGCHTTNHAHGR